jgi:hypothetical protein
LPADVTPVGKGRNRSVGAILAFVGMAAVALSVLRLADRQSPAPGVPSSGHVVFVDTVGWYGRTPDEVAALTEYELTIDALPGSLPLQLGAWIGADRPHDPAVDRYLDHPDVSLERTYWRQDGEIVWLTAFGSRGARSFHLFEHTPETCYPLGGWAVSEFGHYAVPMGPRPLPLNRGVATGANGDLVFLYFYLWNSPERASERGVLTFRVASPVTRTPQLTTAVLAEDFLPLILGPTIDWSRF